MFGIGIAAGQQGPDRSIFADSSELLSSNAASKATPLSSTAPPLPSSQSHAVETTKLFSSSLSAFLPA
jgi:hypothetical protein